MREVLRPVNCTHPGATCEGCRSLMRDQALKHAPGRPVLLLRPAPVKVRSCVGNAVAYTVTDVLVEWDEDSCYHLRWEASWLVRRCSGQQAVNSQEDVPLPSRFGAMGPAPSHR